jgi:hypothetical protein
MHFSLHSFSCQLINNKCLLQQKHRETISSVAATPAGSQERLGTMDNEIIEDLKTELLGMMALQKEKIKDEIFDLEKRVTSNNRVCFTIIDNHFIPIYVIF